MSLEFSRVFAEDQFVIQWSDLFFLLDFRSANTVKDIWKTKVFYSLLSPCVILQSHLRLVSGSTTCFRAAAGWPVSSDQCLISIFNFRNHRLGGGFTHTDLQSVDCWSKNKWQCWFLINPNMLVSGMIAEVQDMFEWFIWVAGMNGACCMTN